MWICGTALFSAICIAVMIYFTQVLDRDEARYAQTSFQISETNDFINQNKKYIMIHIYMYKAMNN